MTEEIYRKYARLMLEVGVNLQKGQKLYVQLESCHWDFGKVLVDEAYKLGAGYVLVEAGHPSELEARVMHSNVDDLEYVPAWVKDKFQTMVDEKWARLFFFGSSEPDLASRLDGQRLGAVQKAGRKASHLLAKASGAGEISWAGAALPTPKWAAKVFPEASEGDAYELLWKELITILKLDASDPSEEWKAIGENVSSRAERLTVQNFTHLLFKSKNTDLKVGLLDKGKWIGGGSDTQDGVATVPNIPTFETFATPDYRQTQGKATVTYPVEVLGLTILGAWFEFKDGKVVDYGADENKEVLDRLFDICPQAKFLGEVALVDSTSPIYQSGKVFHSILFDENATSHVALGNGYVSAVSGAETLSQEELLECGVNVSFVHHDFMIGSDDLSVDGVLQDGSLVPVMRDGKFTELFS